MLRLDHHHHHDADLHDRDLHDHHQLLDHQLLDLHRVEHQFHDAYGLDHLGNSYKHVQLHFDSLNQHRDEQYKDCHRGSYDSYYVNRGSHDHQHHDRHYVNNQH